MPPNRKQVNHGIDIQGSWRDTMGLLRMTEKNDVGEMSGRQVIRRKRAGNEIRHKVWSF